MAHEVGAVKTTTVLDRLAAWDEVGRRLSEIDPEMFARLLIKAARYIDVFDQSTQRTFDEAYVTAILLAASAGCG